MYTSADWTEIDIGFMRRALELASASARSDEVPVGAVVVSNGRIIGEGRNSPIASQDPTAHAEVLAIRAAGQQAQNYRLPGSTLYVTLEPCAMCAGAIVSARIERLVFAARDIRAGAVRSLFQLADSDLLNHRVAVEEGLLAAESAEILLDFFKRLR